MANRMPLLLLLGSGELGKEVAISAKRLGCRVVACDSYAGAPAMQVSDGFEVLNMLDGDALEGVIRRHAEVARAEGRAFFVVPEVEAIRTERLVKVERDGVSVVPSARAADLTMNRDAIRALAAETLKLPTARYGYAESAAELRERIEGKKGTGLPCVIKPVMSSSGKGQSVVRRVSEIDAAWEYAVANMRGDTRRVIAEEFIDFDYEITVLTVRQRPVVGGKKLKEKDRTLFVRPIGHRQERGDYMESWMPCAMKPALVKKAQKMAAAVTREIAGQGGAGLFGVEFFVRGNEVIFSELSPRPHDTGMVTMISQDLSEFDLHVRAVLGLPIAKINYVKGGAASAVILAGAESAAEPSYAGVERALALKDVQVRLFGKPSTRKYRRMGVALATAGSAGAARRLATRAAALVRVEAGA
ncbi:MAG TPA: formate-dependent phosphoribosylglycinamide formyltransferase [Phycisphaerales bacterium]|nr:formate-dependent phosphoribosylglycinamide formyltransferase [Phycisphaerales bacterium]